MGCYNFNYWGSFTVKQLAETIIKLTGSHSRIVYKPLPQDDPVRRKPDNLKAINKLCWKPVVDINSGLSSTIEYFSRYQEMQYGNTGNE